MRRKPLRMAVMVLAAAASWLSGIEIFRATAFPVAVIATYWDLLESIPESVWQRISRVAIPVHRLCSVLTYRVLVGPLGLFFSVIFWVVIIFSLKTNNGYALMTYLLVVGFATGPAILLDERGWEQDQLQDLVITSQ